jgi:hypothetical protein
MKSSIKTELYNSFCLPIQTYQFLKRHYIFMEESQAKQSIDVVQFNISCCELLDEKF